jgi:predicted negative regulator of RcsB-dependent stress response
VPQLILVAAIGAGAYFGYRWLKKQMREAAIAAAEEVAKKKNPSRSDSAREAGNLVWDEKAGVYRTRD